MNVKSNDDIKSKIAILGLYNVIDPEIGLNIVDLGLVYQIDFNELNKDVFLNMTLTTQFCPMGESIIEATTQAMQQSFPEYNIHINLTFEPSWNSNLITEEGQNFLNS